MTDKNNSLIFEVRNTDKENNILCYRNFHTTQFSSKTRNNIDVRILFNSFNHQLINFFKTIDSDRRDENRNQSLIFELRNQENSIICSRTFFSPLYSKYKRGEDFLRVMFDEFFLQILEHFKSQDQENLWKDYEEKEKMKKQSFSYFDDNDNDDQ